MSEQQPIAYCFFQDIEPRPPLDAVFERDYLLYAVTGALNVTVDGQSWLLPPSFAAWVPARTPFVADISKPVTSCSVLVQKEFCAKLPRHPTVFQMSDLARMMINHCRGWGQHDVHPPEAETFFLALLNLCATLVDVSVDVLRPTAKDPIVARSLLFLEDRLDETLTTSAIASAANTSERTLQRRFEDHLGATLMQTVTRLRMIRAIEFLTTPQMPIIQIAGACGYTSLSAFNRAFLQFAKVTPSEFRKRLDGP
ncbi:MAG: helix-turn-helix transcriptional regulator [Sulfitobacter sp.]